MWKMYKHVISCCSLWLAGGSPYPICSLYNAKSVAMLRHPLVTAWEWHSFMGNYTSIDPSIFGLKVKMLCYFLTNHQPSQQQDHKLGFSAVSWGVTWGKIKRPGFCNKNGQIQYLNVLDPLSSALESAQIIDCFWPMVNWGYMLYIYIYIYICM